MYVIQYMLEDIAINQAEEISHEEMLEAVNDFNYGELGHCDAWFKLHHVDGEGNKTEVNISDFFDEAENYMANK